MVEDAIVRALDFFGGRLEAHGVENPRVVLFGSHARGGATKGSDVDAAVISVSFEGKDVFERVGLVKDAVAETVRQFIYRCGLNGRTPGLSANEWWMTDLARELSVPWGTLNRWRKSGWLNARQTKGRRRRSWIAWADVEELARLRRLRDHPAGNKPYPTDLTTPKVKSEN